jgi:hypothetical protein
MLNIKKGLLALTIIMTSQSHAFLPEDSMRTLIEKKIYTTVMSTVAPQGVGLAIMQTLGLVTVTVPTISAAPVLIPAVLTASIIACNYASVKRA